jgi:hypothetical protein
MLENGKIIYREYFNTSLNGSEAFTTRKTTSC